MPGTQNPGSNSVGNGSGNNSGTPIQPSEEDIQEIHTVLADAAAEFRRSSAVTVVTKAGTNQIYGSLYEDYNGGAFNAERLFVTCILFRVDNNFAASLGGPIRTDKPFYFGDYEGGREIGRIVVNGNVLLPACCSGNVFPSMAGTLMEEVAWETICATWRRNQWIPIRAVAP